MLSNSNVPQNRLWICSWAGNCISCKSEHVWPCLTSLKSMSQGDFTFLPETRFQVIRQKIYVAELCWWYRLELLGPKWPSRGLSLWRPSHPNKSSLESEWISEVVGTELAQGTDSGPRNQCSLLMCFLWVETTRCLLKGHGFALRCLENQPFSHHPSTYIKPWHGPSSDLFRLHRPENVLWPFVALPFLVKFCSLEL